MRTNLFRSFFSRLVPRSLLSRMLVLLLLAIVLAQSLISGIWMQQFQKRELDGIIQASRDLANSAAATAAFFKSLPTKYRPIALDQLRNMGGSRFFVSLNKEKITLHAIPDNVKKQLVLQQILVTMHQRLGAHQHIEADFSYPNDLHVFNNQTLLSDLPPSWSRYTLLMEPINPPILVMQLQLENGDWLYLAALLPAPYMSLDEDTVSPHQFRFIILLTIILFPFTFALVRWQTRPLRHLASAAISLGKDIDQPPLPEAGASEIVAVTRAMNIMQLRIRRYISDREKLFSSISHDLKTPITRLRLRVELLDDETQIAKFEKDLNDLEMMVKGALQTVKDTHIHENIESIDINQLLEYMAEDYNMLSPHMTIEGHCKHPYRGKPLALKRCIANLIDNAIKYGDQARVIVMDDLESDQKNNMLYIYVIDEGPGIPEHLINKVFEPYYRIEHENTTGNGLGLGIARSIARAHGGDLVLENRPQGGLQALLSLPRN